MPVGEVDIVNDALIALGASKITSLTQSTENARVMSGAYPSARDTLLQARPWAFATGQASLAMTSTEPLFEFSRQFALPGDFLSILRAWPEWQRYRIFGRMLLSCENVVRIEYVRRVVDPNEMPPLFRLALSKRLALLACKKVTGASLASTERAVLIEEAREALREAAHHDSVTSGQRFISRPTAYMRSRYGYPVGDAMGESHES